MTIEQPCPMCDGSGGQAGTGMEHATGCDGYRCASDCPVPVPVFDPCDFCGGYGVVRLANRGH